MNTNAMPPDGGGGSLRTSELRSDLGVGKSQISSYRPPGTEVAVAMHNFDGRVSASCIPFRAGQLMHIFRKDTSGWCDAEVGGKRGWVPSAYIMDIDTYYAQQRYPSNSAYIFPDDDMLLSDDSSARKSSMLDPFDSQSSERDSTEFLNSGGVSDLAASDQDEDDVPGFINMDVLQALRVVADLHDRFLGGLAAFVGQLHTFEHIVLASAFQRLIDIARECSRHAQGVAAISQAVLDASRNATWTPIDAADELEQAINTFVEVIDKFAILHNLSDRPALHESPEPRKRQILSCISALLHSSNTCLALIKAVLGPAPRTLVINVWRPAGVTFPSMPRSMPAPSERARVADPRRAYSQSENATKTRSSQTETGPTRASTEPSLALDLSQKARVTSDLDSHTPRKSLHVDTYKRTLNPDFVREESSSPSGDLTAVDSRPPSADLRSARSSPLWRLAPSLSNSVPKEMSRDTIRPVSPASLPLEIPKPLTNREAHSPSRSFDPVPGLPPLLIPPSSLSVDASLASAPAAPLSSSVPVISASPATPRTLRPTRLVSSIDQELAHALTRFLWTGVDMSPTNEAPWDLWMQSRPTRRMSSFDDAAVSLDEALVRDGNRSVLGGSLSSIVRVLSENDQASTSPGVRAFFNTFRMFATAHELLDALFAQYARATSMEMRNATVRFMYVWLSQFWFDRTDATVLDRLRDFTAQTPPTELQAPLDALTKLVHCRLQEGGSTPTMPKVDVQPAGAPAPLISRSQSAALRSASDMREVSLLDLEPLELARQITLVENALYCSISPLDLLFRQTAFKGEQLGSSSSSIKAMSLLTTQLTNWMGECILRESDIKRRTQLLRFFVRLGDDALDLRNYNLLMAVLGALNSSTVLRLKRTWAGLSNKAYAQFEQQRAVMEHTRNFSAYRAQLRVTRGAAVPFVGLILTDVTFCMEGNPVMRKFDGHDAALINFVRCSKLQRIVDDMQRFQKPYALTPVPEIQQLIEKLRADGSLQSSTDYAAAADQLYQRSLQLEPRDVQRPSFQRTRSNSVANTLNTLRTQLEPSKPESKVVLELFSKRH